MLANYFFFVTCADISREAQAEDRVADRLLIVMGYEN